MSPRCTKAVVIFACGLDEPDVRQQRKAKPEARARAVDRSNHRLAHREQVQQALIVSIAYRGVSGARIKHGEIFRLTPVPA